jgi:anti-sigma B factor antagonist
VTDFEASVRAVGDPGMITIDLVGTIDGGAEAALDAVYAQCDAHAARAVGLDFTRVEYINSTGIALLVSLLAKARRDDRPVAAWGLTEHYREIFQLTRLDDAIAIHSTEADALAAVTR